MEENPTEVLVAIVRVEDTLYRITRRMKDVLMNSKYTWSLDHLNENTWRRLEPLHTARTTSPDDEYDTVVQKAKEVIQFTYGQMHHPEAKEVSEVRRKEEPMKISTPTHRVNTEE